MVVKSVYIFISGGKYKFDPTRVWSGYESGPISCLKVEIDSKHINGDFVNICVEFILEYQLLLLVQMCDYIYIIVCVSW